MPKFSFTRFLGALAALAVLSLAPSAASAHAGHKHHPAPAVEHTAKAPSAAVQAEMTAAQDTPSMPASDTNCGLGCCSSGPCTGCHGGVLSVVAVPMPPLTSHTMAFGNAPPRGSPEAHRLRRPPKSFA